MSTQTIKDLKERFLEGQSRAWNEGEIGTVDEYFADNVVTHNLGRGEVYKDREGFKAWIREVRSEFPDFSAETVDTVIGEDNLVWQWRANGTNKGEFVPIGQPATNEYAEWEGISVFSFEDENVVEAWWYYDMLGLLQQLGIVQGDSS